MGGLTCRHAKYARALLRDKYGQSRFLRLPRVSKGCRETPASIMEIYHWFPRRFPRGTVHSEVERGILSRSILYKQRYLTSVISDFQIAPVGCTDRLLAKLLWTLRLHTCVGDLGFESAVGGLSSRCKQMT